ncbi:MAG: SurA N-terminal domain-containing protein, partial [Candidatus Aminicenantes bacterium]|nr:SurA N-terminal domain-containing protein [Candidatus Aminicenantes bacterium]
MLKSMRNNVKSLSWTLWLVILAFIGFIFVQWGSGRFESEGLDRDVAAVGRHKISGEEFQKNLGKSLEMYSKQFKNSLTRQMINQFGIAEQVLQGMVSGLIIQGEAEKLNLDISESELQDAIRAYPAFQNEGKFIGSDEYERLLAYNQMTVRDFENGLKKDLLGDKLKELVTAGRVLDLNMLKEEYRKENDKAELDFITFKSDAISEEPASTEAEQLDFYQKNKNLFQSMEKRAGDVLALKFDDFKKEITLKEEEVFAYYKNNKSVFKVPGKTKISRIWIAYDAQTREQVLKQMEDTAALLTPDNFAAKAMELSGDENAKNGGDWGYWGWQNFSNQEQSMINNLKQGEISSPVDAGQGFSILFAQEKIAEQQENYEAVKTRIKSIMENDKLKKLTGERIAAIYEKIKAADNLKQGAGNLAEKVTVTGLLTRGQAIKGIDEMGYISQKLFTLSENELSQPLDFPEGIAVVRLTKIVRPEVEKYEIARDKVKKELQAAKKLQLQLARARSVAADLNMLADPGKLEAYLKKENLKP